MAFTQEQIVRKLDGFEARIPSHAFIHTLGFTAANDAHLIEKIPQKVSSGAWALDLETGTGPDAKVKEKARNNIAQALWTLNLQPAVDLYIRTNSVLSPEFEKDLAVLLSEKPEELKAARKEPLIPKGIVLPKVGSMEELQFATKQLENLETEHQLFRGTFSLIGIIETGAGLNNLKEIVSVAEQNYRMGYLAYGEEDLRFDLGVSDDEMGAAAMEERRNHFIDLVGPSRLQAIDRVWTNARDLQGLQNDTKKGLSLGFRAKMVISPQQIEPVLQGFSAEEQEITQREKIVAAYEQALSKGGGVAVVDGRLVERQHYLQALQFLFFVYSLPAA